MRKIVIVLGVVVGLIWSFSVLAEEDKTISSGGPYQADEHTVLLMHFDELDGNPKDSSKFGNDAYSNTATWTGEGKFGPALQFDGIDDAVVIASNKNLQFKGAITCEAWIKCLGLGGEKYQTILAKPGEYMLHLWKDGSSICFLNWGSLGTIGADVDFRDKQWHHVAATYDGKKRNFYIDGELRESDEPSGSIENSNAPFSIGTYFKGTEFNGLIDEVRISNIVRTFKASDK